MTSIYNREYLLKSESTVEVIEGAANNLPDDRAHAAARKICEYANGLTAGDLAIVLISGMSI